MSINQDFLTIRQLDVETKLIEPTSRLITQVNSQISTLIKDTESLVREWHSDIANFSIQAYEQPSETFQVVYDKSVQEWHDAYAIIHEQLWPKAEQIVIKINELSQQTQLLGQSLMNDPKTVLSSSIDQFSTRFIHGLETSQILLNSINEQLTNWSSSLMALTEAKALSLYYACGEILKLLLNQPLETVQAIFYNTVASLLDIYFHVISSLFSMALTG